MNFFYFWLNYGCLYWSVKNISNLNLKITIEIVPWREGLPEAKNYPHTPFIQRRRMWLTNNNRLIVLLNRLNIPTNNEVWCVFICSDLLTHIFDGMRFSLGPTKYIL